MSWQERRDRRCHAHIGGPSHQKHA
jgi:hypothetical protein